MSITRYTTPPISLLVKGVNLTSATSVYVTLKQSRVVLNIESSPISGMVISQSGDDTQITFSLTQEQAGQFKNAFAEIQVNWISGGIRYATEIAKVMVYNNLLEEVIS